MKRLAAFLLLFSCGVALLVLLDGSRVRGRFTDLDTHGLELVHGAPDRNGPRALHEGVETTAHDAHAADVLHGHPCLALVAAPHDLARRGRLYKSLVEAGRESRFQQNAATIAR